MYKNQTNRRRYRKRQNPRTKKAANLAPQTANAVRKIIKYEKTKEVEDKQFAAGKSIVAYFGTTTQATNTLQSLLDMTQGTADNQRVGDEVTLKHIQFRISFGNNSGTGSGLYSYARLVIFQYKQTNATAPNISNMFLNGAGTAQVNIYSAINIDHQSTYTVLYDKVFKTVGALGTGTSIPDSYTSFHRINIPLKYAKKRIKYIAGGSNCMDQIYYVILGEQPSVSLNPYHSADWTIRYTDC